MQPAATSRLLTLAPEYLQNLSPQADTLLAPAGAGLASIHTHQQQLKPNDDIYLVTLLTYNPIPPKTDREQNLALILLDWQADAVGARAFLDSSARL
ncbi:MAG: hypothetical protein M1829_001528 [Trizodia sp. TS-e1964]|nr:MAG: hypothetical protein M1829_001528 [Trizodia sp. TS-e1964]